MPDYERINWEDLPSRETPLNAENLNQMDEAIYNLAVDSNEKRAELDELKDNLFLQTRRLDKFTTLPEGSTTGDAEVADIRIGYNGRKYSQAGNAVRKQIEDIHSLLRDYADGFIYEEKPVDGIEWETDENEADSVICTEPISVVKDTKIGFLQSLPIATNVITAYEITVTSLAEDLTVIDSEIIVTKPNYYVYCYPSGSFIRLKAKFRPSIGMSDLIEMPVIDPDDMNDITITKFYSKNVLENVINAVPGEDLELPSIDAFRTLVERVDAMNDTTILNDGTFPGRLENIPIPDGEYVYLYALNKYKDVTVFAGNTISAHLLPEKQWYSLRVSHHNTTISVNGDVVVVSTRNVVTRLLLDSSTDIEAKRILFSGSSYDDKTYIVSAGRVIYAYAMKANCMLEVSSSDGAMSIPLPEKEWYIYDKSLYFDTRVGTSGYVIVFADLPIYKDLINQISSLKTDIENIRNMMNEAEALIGGDEA